MAVNLAFITYETPFAPCGGVASVMGHLPQSVKESSGLSTVVITPFHYHIKKTSSLKTECIGEVSVAFNGSRITVEVLQREDKISWYFLRPKDKRFFAGKNHPYDMDQENLVRDSLFFGVAATCALNVIQSGVYWTLLMQDWEAATAALAMAGQGKGCRLFLVLHNSYDSGAVSPNMLRKLEINPDNCPGGSSMATVLERALPLVEWPVITVSDQYALDLTEDILQAEIMAPHLRDRLRSRVLGINNGLFMKPSVKNDITTDAREGNFAPLDKWKSAKRKKFIKIIKGLRPSKKKPVWGNLKKFNYDDSPWFVMAGRDDPRQKGYDVAAAAVSEFLKQGGDAKFLFFPMPGEEGLDGLGFMEDLAGEYPENILVFPFRLEKGYFEAMQGATYGIMPSLYEPFGMANEFYLNGTVGIGRATGGLLQQIVPWRGASSFNKAVKKRADHWHSPQAQPTGILYREKDNLPTIIENWRGINAAKYRTNKTSGNRLKQRQMFSLFNSMADELLKSIDDGVKIYREDRPQYYKMLTQGITYIQQNFSWEQTASEYLDTFFSWERLDHIRDSE